MGIDRSLSDDLPTIHISGERYYVSRDRLLIEHEIDGKRFWDFTSEQEMQDFLDNLPESSRPPTYQGGPVWYTGGNLSNDELDALWEQHRLLLRELLAERRKLKGR